MGDEEKNTENIEENEENNSVEENESTEESGAEEKKPKSEKTFTQDQVTRMMTREKNQGRNAVFKELGINPKDAKMIETIKAFTESAKKQAKVSGEDVENEALHEAEQRALVAEAKAEAMTLGAQKQYVDDLVTLALSNFEDGGDLKTIFGELKTKYPVWFEPEETKNNEGKKGTGSSITNVNKGNGANENSKQGIGSRLAAQRRAQNGKKSSFFSR